MTKLTTSIQSGDIEMIISVDYDPSTNRVESVNQVLEVNHRTRFRKLLPVDRTMAMLAGFGNWWEVYKQEMEAAEYERECHMRMYDEMQGHALTVFDHFQMGLI